MNSTLRRAALALAILASLTACKPAADGAPKTDVAAATAAPAAAPTSGIDLAGIDKAVQPGDDFDEYASCA